MKFESLLARRYIYSQKRHSLLTIFSIIIAVALMTMIVTCYSTLTGIQRASHYDAKPYHIQFSSMTESQVQELSKLPKVETLNKEISKTDSSRYTVQIMFGGYLDEACQKEFNRIFENAKIPPEDISYNEQLIEDDLLTDASRYNLCVKIALLYVFLIFLALTLRLMIDTAFEVSSKERERQFGVLQSVGASPKQIVKILTHEGLMLSVVGVPLGAAAGIGFGYLAYRAVLSSGVADVYIAKEKIEQLVHYHVSPVLMLLSMLVGTAWVWISAYSTGMRIIKMPPIQAISNRSNTIKKVKNHSLLGLLFGWKGKLAARNARRQPKRFFVTVLSLTLSLTLFAIFSTIMDSFSQSLVSSMKTYDMLGEDTPEMNIVYGVRPPRGEFDVDIVGGDSDTPATEEEMQAYYEKVMTLQKNTDYTDAHRPVENAEKLKATGYFRDIDYYLAFSAKSEYAGFYAVFASEGTYNRIFDYEPKTSYAEFEKSGKALLLNYPDYKNDEITLDLMLQKQITKAEYDKIYEEMKAGTTDKRVRTFGYNFPVTDADGNQHEMSEALLYGMYISRSVTVPIGEKIKLDRYGTNDDGGNMPVLFLPYSYYEQYVHEPDYYVNLDKYQVMFANEADYQSARQYVDSSDEFYVELDLFKSKKNLSTVISAVRIGVTAGNIMLALIAIVNMINIVSTGILNRKSELGSLQCIGMTRGQETATAIFECVQFVIFSGIAATVLSKLLTMGTEYFFYNVMGLAESDSGGNMITFGSTLVKIWGGTAAAFVVALISSLIPLHIMNKQELVDQIRTVE